MFRKRSSVIRASNGLFHLKVGGSNPSVSTKLCWGSSEGFYGIVKSASVDYFIGVEHHCERYLKNESLSFSRILEANGGRWFESIPRHQFMKG